MDMTTDMLAPEEVFAAAALAAPAELNPLALLTIKPEEYVAQVFAPFRTKLATLKAEADAIYFDAAVAPDAPAAHVDITTTAGMAIAVKYRAAFRDDVRLDVEKTKTARKAPILQIGRLIDSTYKAIVDEVAPYEGKFDGAIKAEEKRKADIKAAKERAEAERIGTIKAAIEAIRALPARAVGKSSEELRALLERVAARMITKEEFDQFDGEAQTALDAAGQELVAMFEAALATEVAAAAAEAVRQAELKVLADQKVEQARVAAEQAATAKRLADAEAELQKRRDIATAAAQAEADKVAAANAAAAKVIADAAKALADREAAFQRKQDEVAAAAARAEHDRVEAEALRAKVVADHEEAHGMNYQFDADREDERARLQELADQQLADARDRAADEQAAGLPAGALGVEAIADMTITEGPTAMAILDCAAKAVADEFDATIVEAVEMIAGIERADFEVARELAEAA